MAGSRAPMRFASVALAIAAVGMAAAPAVRSPQRILVLHRLLLGDTLMVTALLAQLRARFPAAEIVMTVTPAYVPLYAGRPYGVTSCTLDPRDFARSRRCWQRRASISRSCRRTTAGRGSRVPSACAGSWASPAIVPRTRTGRSTNSLRIRRARPRMATPRPRWCPGRRPRRIERARLAAAAERRRAEAD